MKVFATYNLKGGVGKTATAVNLAYLAGQSGFRTLIWDLDAQGAATFYLRRKASIKGGTDRLLKRKRPLPKIVKSTEYENVDLVPSDFSLRNLDIELASEKHPQRRLKKLLKAIKNDYDIVILDCAPTISVASESIIESADWLLVPLIPTHLSLRAYEQLKSYFLNREFNGAHLMPFFSMVDKRKRLHRDLIVDFAATHPELIRSFIPYLSQIEQMGIHRAPVATFAAGSQSARAFDALWRSVCDRARLSAGPDG